MYYIVLIFIFILLLAFFLLYKYTRKTKLNSDKKKFLLNKCNKILKGSVSYKEKIIDLDKLYHLSLKELGYKGTFGEILKSQPREVFDLNKIWELHKLRNKLVHDFDLLTNSVLNKKVKEYEIQIKKLIS